MSLVAASGTYIAVMCLLAFLNKREFLRCPEKGERYKALPLQYKLACWIVVVPLFVSTVFVHPVFFLLAIASFAFVEILCVRWYQRHGYLRA